MNHEQRFGRFTSSENYKLMTVGKDKVSFGKPALTYIERKQMEIRLGRSLDIESNARPLQWGKVCEAIAFNTLGTKFTLQSDETIVHSDYEFWSGTPDLVHNISEVEKICGDIKCPFTLTSFCSLVDNYAKDGIKSIRDNHDDGEKYYWQIVSNAILLEAVEGYKVDKGEIVVYMPYLKDLHRVKDDALSMGWEWIQFSFDAELPYLLEDGYYKDINVLTFDIPQSDKDLLTENIIKASKLL